MNVNNIEINNNDKKYTIKKQIKCVILGDSGVGKTSIIQKFQNNNFNTYNETTLGAIYWELPYQYSDDLEIKINFWDTAGQERYQSLIPMYVRNCDIIILTFDLTNMDSFINLKKWLLFTKNNYSRTRIIVLGNKEDLSIYHRVEDDDIQLFLNESFNDKPAFFRTSAKENINIEEVFKYIFEITNEIIENRLNSKVFVGKAIQINDKELGYKCCNIL
tara:strand:- start:269 stop:922 length:654 start_codon:yes stop_codon:yes gene_type:complete